MTRPELIAWAEKNKGAGYTISKVAEAVLELASDYKDLVEEHGRPVLQDQPDLGGEGG